MPCCVCVCQKERTRYLKYDNLTADYWETFRSPPIWSSRQIKTLHDSFLSIFFFLPRSVWICFLDKQSVHLIRQEIESPHIRERAWRGHWRFPRVGGREGGVDVAHLGGFGGEAEVLLLAFECVPVKSCVLHCLISLVCKTARRPLIPLHPRLPLALFMFWIPNPLWVFCASAKPAERDTWKNVLFVHWDDLNFRGVPPGFTSVRIDQKFQTLAQNAERGWIGAVEMLCCLSAQRWPLPKGHSLDDTWDNSMDLLLGGEMLHKHWAVTGSGRNGSFLERCYKGSFLKFSASFESSQLLVGASDDSGFCQSNSSPCFVSFSFFE